jgi:hypothetical protein
MTKDSSMKPGNPRILTFNFEPTRKTWVRQGRFHRLDGNVQFCFVSFPAKAKEPRMKATRKGR